MNVQQPLEEIASPEDPNLTQNARSLANALQDKAASSGFAADVSALAREVNRLCDYVDQVRSDAEILLSKLERSRKPASSEFESAAEEEKAKEIQREVHTFSSETIDYIKGLLMWRDAPKERLWKEE